MKTGFIGLGNIGKPMAKRLARSEFPLTVFDINPVACEELAKLGAAVAKTPAALARDADVIGICVRDDNDVKSVMLGDAGLLATARAGTVIAIHSTVTQATVLAMAEAGRGKGVVVIDAPITGGAGGAENGTLCYMVGGDAAVVEKVRPVFMTSAQKVIHAGDLGAGIALKLCNNLVTYAEFIAIHEASKLAEAAGLSLAVLGEVGQANGVITPQMQMFIENRNALFKGCSEADFKAIFGGFAALGVKDLQAALASAAELGIELPATTVNQTLIEKVFFNAY